MAGLPGSSAALLRQVALLIGRAGAGTIGVAPSIAAPYTITTKLNAAASSIGTLRSAFGVQPSSCTGSSVAGWARLRSAFSVANHSASPSCSAFGSLRAFHSASGSAASRTPGMLLSMGVMRRGAGTGSPSQGVASTLRSRPLAPMGLLALPARLKATVAATGEAAAAAAAVGGAAAAAAAPRYGSAALSAGLSPGARTALASWLGLTAVWVYSMVVLGGITRLTRSGLSMTEWKLAGERPPMSEADWEAEFAKYKASPEYLKVHRSMTLEEFKFIYWMEYAHRMWGRFLGLAFALPAAAFAARGWVNGALARRLGLLFVMGGTQGLVGWWMVRSGLEEPEHEWAQPRVSPYRLAAHLVSAFAIYATLVWTTLDLMYPRPATAGSPEGVLRATASARGRLLPLAALISVTATSGAFVAGMDAGRAYNTWPLMGGQLVPDEYWGWEGLGLTPLRNMFENTAAVQFNHRMLATTTLFAVGASWLSYRRTALPPRAVTCLHVVGALTAAQFAAGVYTLLQYVPVSLGSLHQANALNLFTAVLALLHACRPPAPAAAAAALAPYVTPAAAVAVGLIGYTVASQNGTLTESERYRGPSKGKAE